MKEERTEEWRDSKREENAFKEMKNLSRNIRNYLVVVYSLYDCLLPAFISFIQVTYEAGMAWHLCCWMLAGASSFVVLLTPLFPRHHVPYARLCE